MKEIIERRLTQCDHYHHYYCNFFCNFQTASFDQCLHASSATITIKSETEELALALLANTTSTVAFFGLRWFTPD